MEKERGERRRGRRGKLFQMVGAEHLKEPIVKKIKRAIIT